MDTKGRILVIDDEIGIRMGCQRALSSQGYVVDAAANGKEGLDKIEQEGYDLVLLDIMMPGMGGMETLRRIPNIDANLVCIVITGYATVELAVQAIKQGAYDFITKPFDADTLLLTVEQGMEKRQLSLQARRLEALEVEARELARQKDDLERLDRMKSTFTLTVAHELRAPVAAIQSYLRLILDGYIPPENQRMYLERAERRALAQLDLITDLLDLAYLQDPDRPVSTEPVQLEQVLAEVADSMAAAAEEKEIHVEIAVSPGLPAVNMSPQHAKQLWTNLVSNAIKYTPQGGQVYVSLTREDVPAGEAATTAEPIVGATGAAGQLVGSVRDTGIGIAADELGLIFEEFFRTKASKAHTQMGTGLGLTIVKRVLEAYGGTISVESTPGEGSCFTFTLPIR
jgi:signal transduction histidine kinase